MSGTMLGDTVMNITINHILPGGAHSFSGCCETHEKKVLQTSKDYTVMKYCSSPVFFNLVNDITIYHCPTWELSSTPSSFILPTIPINHQASFDSPSEKSDMYYFSSSFPCFYSRPFVPIWIITSLLIIMIMASIYWSLTIWQALC